MAIASLKGTTQQTSDIVITSDNTTLSDKNLSVKSSSTASFKLGTGVGEADKVYTAKVSIALSTTLSLDLDAGTLLDPFGNALTFTALKSIRILHDPASIASSVDVQGDFITTNLGASTSIPLTPRASFSYIDDQTGLAVTATTGDVIDIVNNDGSNAADVIIELVGV